MIFHDLKGLDRLTGGKLFDLVFDWELFFLKYLTNYGYYAS
jgi:hypothetical protein